MFKQWLEDNNIDNITLVNEKKTDLYTSFIDYLSRNQSSYMSLPSFNKLLDSYLLSNNLMNIHTRKKHIKEEMFNKKGLSKENKELLEFVKNDFANTVEDMQDIIKNSIIMVGNSLNIQSNKKCLILQGPSGIGKTDLVLKTLKESNFKYKRFRGTIKSVNDFYKALYKNNNTIIIFDDVPHILKRNTPFLPFLLSALDDFSGAKRKLTLLDKKDKEIVNIKPIIEIENEPLYPQSFDYTGSMIFITNMLESRMDKALVSRSYFHSLRYTKEDIIEAISSNFDNYCSEYTTTDKEEVVNFLVDFKNHINFDFRTYKDILGLKITTKLWKETALKSLYRK
jgi:hypothetical protein